MNTNYKKTLLGSIIAFFLGTSCCWISALIMWIGGATILGTVSSYIGNIQFFLIAVGLILSFRTVFLYLKSNG